MERLWLYCKSPKKVCLLNHIFVLCHTKSLYKRWLLPAKKECIFCTQKLFNNKFFFSGMKFFFVKWFTVVHLAWLGQRQKGRMLRSNFYHFSPGWLVDDLCHWVGAISTGLLSIICLSCQDVKFRCHGNDDFCFCVCMFYFIEFVSLIAIP